MSSATESPAEAANVSVIDGRKILVIDDHRNIRVSLGLTLSGEGAGVTEAENCQQAQSQLTGLPDRLAFDAVLLDIRLPDGSGLDILSQLSQAGLASRVIMISGEGTVGEAFQATQMGAFDYIEKPFAPERILVSVARCLEFNRMQSTNKRLSAQVLKGQEIMGQHPAIVDMLGVVKRVAPTNGRVLILGESGTGKELVARALHRESRRADQDLVKVNCAAIPQSLIESELFGHEKGAFTGALKTRRGLFEQADGGTLFLDEIAELPLEVQAKLLRVLQNGEIVRVGGERTIKVDVRLFAATHRDLQEMVADGEFREDLYYRLNVVTVQVPPLRERTEDIPVLADYFLELACREHSVGSRQFGPAAIQAMHAYGWPGNVRELRNVVERAAILSEEQTIADIREYLPKGARPPASATPDEAGTAGGGEDDEGAPEQGGFGFRCDVMPWQEFHQHLDRAYIKYVLKQSKGNVSEAARMLCLERAYLHRLMRKLGVQRDVVVLD